MQYIPSTSLPWSKHLLTKFAEQYIFQSGEAVKPFWGKRIYPPPPARQGNDTGPPSQEDNKDTEFKDWHTAMQYIEMTQSIIAGRRRSSAGGLE